MRTSTQVKKIRNILLNQFQEEVINSILLLIRKEEALVMGCLTQIYYFFVVAIFKIKKILLKIIFLKKIIQAKLWWFSQSHMKNMQLI